MTEESQFPLVTFALFAYNQENYIREAVEAALAQDYPNLEIIISDDCSPDGTFEIIRESAGNYPGPHCITLNRNPVNLGLGAHVNKIVSQARGELIVLAAGDDISLPNRVSRLVEKWRSEPGCVAVCSDSIVISGLGDDQGTLIGKPFSGSLESGVECYFSGVQGCTCAWSRRVFEVFGEMLPDTICEDRVVPLRSALLGSTGYVAEPLVKYRVHGTNISHFFSTSPEQVIEKTIQIHLRNRNIVRNYLKDIDSARRLGLHCVEQLNPAEQAARSMESRLSAKLKFLQGSFADKLSVMMASLIRDPIQCARWAVMLVLPRVYVRNQMKNFGVK